MSRTKAQWCMGMLVAIFSSGHVPDVALAQSRTASTRFTRLPKGWTVTKTIPAFNGEIGGRAVRITNTFLAADELPIRVNTIVCKSNADAARVHEALIGIQGGVEARCPREDKLIYELIGEWKIIERAHRELGFKPQRVTYDVSFLATPVAKCDDMARNRMYNAFLQPTPNEAAIRELSKSFTFGDQIRVRNGGLGRGISEFEFATKPANSRLESEGEITAYQFPDLASQYGVPQVGITSVITSEAFAITPSRRNAGEELLGATEFWPSADPEYVALAQQITAGSTSPDQKVAALLAWFSYKENFKFDRRIVGSRYGVKTALQQRFGMCWDYSDSFVTLCRAAGVPCRQVHGWLYNVEGHIWAEVLIDGQGWRQVDPQAGGGCDSRYVPIVATETGAMPFVYTSVVRVVRRLANDPPD